MSSSNTFHVLFTLIHDESIASVWLLGALRRDCVFYNADLTEVSFEWYLEFNVNSLFQLAQIYRTLVLGRTPSRRSSVEQQTES